MANLRSNILDSLRAIDSFIGPDLGARIAELEWLVKGCNGAACADNGTKAGVTSGLLSAAYEVKRAAGQIHVIVHAVGMLLILPKIMQPDEQIESVSLGAGNTGKSFDLTTSKRIAEFKFIHWQGGAETMRKKALFKDFFHLAEEPTDRKKEIYLLGTSHALRFLRSGSRLESVVSRSVSLRDGLRAKHGDKFRTVGDYYGAKQHDVAVLDATPLVPELARIVSVAADSQDAEEAEA